jgi:hypothetical protein
MRAELWVRQHAVYSAFVGLLLLLMFWSTITTRSRQTIPVNDFESSSLVAKIGHMLPLPDRHIPFAIEKRNGRYSLVLRTK